MSGIVVTKRMILCVLAASALVTAAQAAETTWFPDGHVYGPYVADPRRPTFAINRMYVPNEDIADTGSPRMEVKTGGSFGIVRRHPESDPLRGWQINIEAGIRAQFDLDHSYDNIGWDGIFGLIWAKGLANGLGFRAGVVHTSSHIGDELIERTGRTRIEYTREEYVGGVSWRFLDSWRTYGEYGWAYNNNNEQLQRSSRAQGGLEWQGATGLIGDGGALYAAADVSSFQENDWDVNTSLHAGIVWPRADRSWRVGLEYYHGRVPIGEFFQDTETYLSFGLRLDF